MLTFYASKIIAWPDSPLVRYSYLRISSESLMTLVPKLSSAFLIFYFRKTITGLYVQLLDAAISLTYCSWQSSLAIDINFYFKVQGSRYLFQDYLQAYCRHGICLMITVNDPRTDKSFDINYLQHRVFTFCCLVWLSWKKYEKLYVCNCMFVVWTN